MNDAPSQRDELISLLADGGGLMRGEPSGFERMSRPRFEALALWGLPQDFRDECEPASFWSADAERLLALVYLKGGPGGAGLAVIARDEHGRYRPFSHQRSIPTARAAEDLLRGGMGRSALALEPRFRQLDGQPAGTDLLAPVPGIDDRALHPAFRYLRDGVAQRAARELIEELGHWVPDGDGNLARDLQTTGYSARIWEIYLTFAFREMGFSLAYRHQSPDFELSRSGTEVFVEATTANSGGRGGTGPAAGAPPGPPGDFRAFIEGEMPLKFGSPLHTKMAKRYWELEHVRGRPLVLAIADFHAPASMTWSHTALPTYLHGIAAMEGRDEKGGRRAEGRRIDAFDKGANSIQPFFEQDGTEHVSAVLFSNAGTIAKFNRMGVRAGFGDRFVSLRRIGGWNDPTPGALDAIGFNLDVESAHYREGWADELELHHNPRALHPIDDAMFPGIANFRMEDGKGIWRGPSPRVLFSQTMTMDLLGRKVDPSSFADE